MTDQLKNALPRTSSTQAPAAYPAAGVSVADLIELLREARMVIGPEYVDLLGRIHDAIHGLDEPVPYVLTEQGKAACR